MARFERGWGLRLLCFLACLACGYAWARMTSKGADSSVTRLALIPFVAGVGFAWIWFRLAPPGLPRSEKVGAVGIWVLSWFAMAIFVPVFESARAPLVPSRCLSNLKQLGIAMMIYTTDWDDRFPPADGWRRLSDVFGIQGCPSTPRRWSYAFNGALSKMKLEALEAPHETVMIFECDSVRENDFGGEERLVYRHGKKGPIAFADGSVSSKMPESELRWRP